VLHSGQLLDTPEELIQTRDRGERILHTKKVPIFDTDGAPQFQQANKMEAVRR
jgi:hypothetical protein